MSGQREREKRQRERGEWIAVEDDTAISVMDRVSARDRRYFARHRERDWYVRPCVAGEYGAYEREPEYAMASHTMVEQIMPGYRVRSPMILLRHRDYPSH